MNATGIVRRIDDLGRIVIPKEMRTTFRLREGDPLEIFINGDEIIFKKYSPVGEISLYINRYADILYKICGLPVAICDKEHIISCAGIPKKDFLKQKISNDLEEVLLSRKTDGEKSIRILDNAEYKTICWHPITISYDICGAIMFVYDDENKEQDEDMLNKLLQTATGFISSQMEP